MKQVYLRDKQGNYYYEEDYEYLIVVDSKKKAKTISEPIALAIKFTQEEQGLELEIEYQTDMFKEEV